MARRQPSPVFLHKRDRAPAGDIVRRTVELDRAALNEDERTVEIAFSSEAEVERYFGTEVLDHQANSVRLNRLNNGGALLVEHDRRDQVGVVVRAWIGDDKKGRAIVRFGKSKRAEEIFQDVKDGIRRLVSVGYRIHRQDTQERPGGVEAVRVTDWEPYELSLVSIPADDSVGVGRNESHPTPKTNFSNSTTMKDRIIARLRALNIQFAADASVETLRALLPEAERAAFVETQPAPAVPPPAPQQRSAPVTVTSEPIPLEAARADFSAELRRRDIIGQIADQARERGIPADARAAIDGGISAEAFRTQVFERLLAQQTPYAPGEAPAPSRQEQRDLSRFSILSGLRSLVQGQPLSGIEAEMHQEAIRDARAAGINLEGNFHIPFIALSGARDMTATGGTNGDQGGTLVPTVHGSFIELLYARMVLRDLGAQFLTGLTGNLDLPKLLTGAAVANKTETGAGDESSPTTGVVSLTPKRATTFVEVSQQLMIQSSPSVEAIVRNDLATALALIIEQRAIAGTGDNNQPRGILNTVGIGSVVGGAAGAAPVWSHVIDLETAVATANADLGALAYLTNPKVRGKMKATPKVSSTDSRMLWESNETPVNGYRAGVTTQVPSTLDKGASVGVCSAMIFGNFADLIVAQWGGLSIMANPYAKDTEGLVRLTLNAYHDSAVRRAGSFSAIKDLLTA